MARPLSPRKGFYFDVLHFQAGRRLWRRCSTCGLTTRDTVGATTIARCHREPEGIIVMPLEKAARSYCERWRKQSA